MFSGRTCSYRIRTALTRRDHRLAHHVLKVPSSSSPISITQGLYHWGLQICLRNSFSSSHFLCVSLKRLFPDSEPQVLTLLPQLRCRAQARHSLWALLPLQALWLPQCSYLAAFTSPFRGSLQRQLIRSGSQPLQGSSCTPDGSNCGKGSKKQQSPHPSSTAAKQVTQVTWDTGRDHTTCLLAQEVGHLCLSLGSGDSQARFGDSSPTPHY